jgi:hypothetical protein
MKSRAFVEPRGVQSPRVKVGFPHVAALVGALACGVVTGCSQQGGDSVLTPVVVGMTEMTPPFFDNGEDQVYEVHMPLQFPLRRPTDAERMKYGPFTPENPWLRAHDFQIEIRYTISNLTDKKQNVEILIDPWNEFVKYQPGLTATEEGAVSNRAGYDRNKIVQPMEKLQGTITNDDTLEMAIDLATVMNIQASVMDPMANLNGMFNNAFDLQNRSSHPELDPLIAKYIPKVAPGLTGVTIGFRLPSPARVALEVIVDIVDLKMDRVIAPGEERTSSNPNGKQLLREPTMILSPPAAPAM